MSDSSDQSTPLVLEGFLSVRAALKANSRPLHRILIRHDKWDRGVAWLEHAARDAGIPLERVASDVIDAQANGKTHGGVLALVGPRRFAPLEALAGAQFVAMLDGVEDPFNFGQSVRALYAAGADGVVVRPRNWMTAASIVARASAGASEWVTMAIAETLQDAADFFRTHGLTVACTAKQRARSIYAADLTVPLFLVIGGEKRGITRSFLDQADLLLEVPYGRDFQQSLGTTGATSVLAFEVMRQRLVAGKGRPSDGEETG